MSLETRLWREASLATSIHGFLSQVGPNVLELLEASTLLVRLVDREHQYIETIATLRRGAVGVTRPSRPRVELSPTATERIASWVENGRLERTSARALTPFARDLLRGFSDGAEGEWWLVPLAAHSEALGALIVNGSRASFDIRKLTWVSEPIAAVLATEHARRELARSREAAEAERSAALARLQVKDIGPVIVGADSGLRDVMQQVEQVATTDAPVLIVGETGSGKEVVARAIHERSTRMGGPLLRVNCGAIAPELVDSELFGHERGSFTGAVTQHRGWFERADGGTLFLDEIGELPLAAQVRLLRVLQDGIFERVGGTRPLRVDVRVIAATHRDLAAMVRSRTFREDLWYRINVFMIDLPPLRERQRDIPELAAHFADRAGRRFGAGPLRVTPADLELLCAYEWPGNVRELAAVIERAAILGQGRRLDLERALGVQASGSPARSATSPAGRANAFPTLAQAMREHIAAALERCQGRIEGAGGAAQLLAIHPNTLRSRMQKLGLRWSRARHVE